MGKAEKTEKTNKKQKHFWKDFKAELKKVIWPTASQVVNNTVIVIVMVIIVTLIVLVLDLAFNALNVHGIDKLKSFARNSVVTETENTNTDNSTENNLDGNTVLSSGENGDSEGNADGESKEVENNVSEENNEAENGTENTSNENNETSDETQNNA